MTNNGKIFLGKDEATYGKAGTGWVDYDPDFECGSGEEKRCAYATNENHTEGLPLKGSQGRDLHINIASYRDPLCPKTLFYMFTKATNPEKLFVRIIQQNDPEVDVDCLEEYCNLMNADKGECPYKDQVFIHNIHAKDAAGPMWARGIISQDMEKAYKDGLIKPQDHCMSIDSHMNFEPDWDSKMVAMWDDANNEYAVLSTYVQDVEHLGSTKHQVPHLCMVKFTSNVRTDATKCANDLIRPKLTNAIWGAGLSFSKCHAELKVMVDPHTPHIFDGEEFNRAARFWTYGYDIYTPNKVLVLHNYHESQSNPIAHTWGMNRNKHGSFADSSYRLYTMIGYPGGEKDEQKAIHLRQSKYGLGDRRSLDQLYDFSGVDVRNRKKSIDGKNRCGNISWVPFAEHPKGVNYIPTFDDKSEGPLDLPYDSTSVWFVPDSGAGASEKTDEFLHGDLRQMHEALQGEADDNEGGKSVENLEDVNEQIDVIAANNLNGKHAALLEKMVKEKMEEVIGVKPIISNAEAMHLDEKIIKVPLSDSAPGGRWQSGKGRMIRGFLVKHHFIPPEQHGIQNLPPVILCSVFVLFMGLVISIIKTAGAGRSFKTMYKRND